MVAKLFYIWTIVFHVILTKKFERFMGCLSSKEAEMIGANHGAFVNIVQTLCSLTYFTGISTEACV